MSFPKPFYRWRPHPWHGLSVGPQPPRVVHAYIEITTYDSVKYEVDKETGYLRVDRPQRFSSQPPALYGFIPRTYCGTRVGQLSPKSQRGDGDPMDICVLSERSISRAEVLLNARVIGGLRMIDYTTAAASPEALRACSGCVSRKTRAGVASPRVARWLLPGNRPSARIAGRSAG